MFELLFLVFLLVVLWAGVLLAAESLGRALGWRR